MLNLAFSRKLARLIAGRPILLAAVLVSMLLGCGWAIKSRQNFDTEVLNLLPRQFESVQGLKVASSSTQPIVCGLVFDYCQPDPKRLDPSYGPEINPCVP